MRELSAPKLQRIGGVSQVDIGMLAQVPGQIRGGLRQGGIGLRRKAERCHSRDAPEGSSAGASSSTTWALVRPDQMNSLPHAAMHRRDSPLAQLGIDLERARGEIDLRVGRGEIQAGTNSRCSSDKAALINPETPAAASEVPHVGLQRAKPARRVPAPAITDTASARILRSGRPAGARAVRFHITDRVGIEPRSRLGERDDLRLAFNAGAVIPPSRIHRC